MFRSFFLSREWFLWAWLGMFTIGFSTWYSVNLTVQLNVWYGEFWDLVQKALSEANAVEIGELYGFILTFGEIAGKLIFVGVLLSFFTKHYIFRWRHALNNFYMAHWEYLRHIEGASQRVQEDTRMFARLMEDLGSRFLDSILTLIAFLPLLWELSKHVTEMPYLGQVDHALVYLAILLALFGTVVLAAIGIKLPGLEFNNQKVEAAYRKELVYGEDDAERADTQTVRSLFADVRQNYFRLFFHYLYFDVAKWSYIQFGIIVPLVVLVPTIASGTITFGVIQRILQAFNRVENSFQFLVHSWTSIVELISVFKRLHAFESQIYKLKSEEKGISSGHS